MIRPPCSRARVASRRPLLLVAAALLLAGPLAPDARAGLVMAVQSSTAQAGSTNGTFDVTLTNTGPSPITIGGFAFELSVANGSGITFTSVDISTTLGYIFAGHSAFGPDISLQPPNLPGPVVEASDAYDTSGKGITLNVGAGSAVGVGHVHFRVSAGASGPIAVTMAAFPLTNLSDANGIDITRSAGLTTSNGTITVTPNAVPEPSSLALTAIALGIGAGSRLARGRRRLQPRNPL